MSEQPIEYQGWTISGAAVSEIAAIVDREGITGGYAIAKSIAVYAVLSAKVADGAAVLVREADGTESEVQCIGRHIF